METVEVADLLNSTWVLIAAVLVIFMQAGFALVEAGMTRSKSVANIMMKNMMDFTVGVLVFFAVGYGLAFGADKLGLFGSSGWLLGSGADGPVSGALDDGTHVAGGSLAVFFLFQAAFAATAATIVSGAMAERTRFKSYLVYSAVISAFIYPVVVHWVWGGGWLSAFDSLSGAEDVGYKDFAGSSVVHMVGGVAALMGAWMLGPRIGKYTKEGKPLPILGHSMPFAVIGAFILLIGWFGFNPGSELVADGAVGNIALTTLLAGVTGAVVSLAAVWMKTGKPDVGMTTNGLLAGLVGITAGCAFVGNMGAIAIGAISGFVVVFSVLFLDKVRIDDPVGAISVHGVCGALGTLLVGVFGIEELVGAKTLVDGGGFGMIATQLVGVVSIAAWVLATAGVLFFALKKTVGLRVSEQDEIDGLDVHEHGAPGYGEMELVTMSTVSGSALRKVASPAQTPLDAVT